MRAQLWHLVWPRRRLSPREGQARARHLFPGREVRRLKELTGSELRAAEQIVRGIDRGEGIATLCRFGHPFVAAPLLQRGDLRALAVTSAQRAPGYAAVPPVAETFPGFDFNGWFAMVAPAGTPPYIVRRMNREIGLVLADPEIAGRLREIGFYTDCAEPPEAAAAFIRKELESWGRLVREIGLQLAHKMPREVEKKAQRIEEYARGFLTGGTMFEELGFYYVGPIDGHNLDHLIPVLENVPTYPCVDPQQR